MCQEENIEEKIRNSNNCLVKGSITNRELLNLILKTHEIDTALHFAAQSHVDNSFSTLQYTL